MNPDDKVIMDYVKDLDGYNKVCCAVAKIILGREVDADTFKMSELSLTRTVMGMAGQSSIKSKLDDALCNNLKRRKSHEHGLKIMQLRDEMNMPLTGGLVQRAEKVLSLSAKIVNEYEMFNVFRNVINNVPCPLSARLTTLLSLDENKMFEKINAPFSELENIRTSFELDTRVGRSNHHIDNVKRTISGGVLKILKLRFVFCWNSWKMSLALTLKWLKMELRLGL